MLKDIAKNDYHSYNNGCKVSIKISGSYMDKIKKQQYFLTTKELVCFVSGKLIKKIGRLIELQGGTKLQYLSNDFDDTGSFEIPKSSFIKFKTYDIYLPDDLEVNIKTHNAKKFLTPVSKDEGGYFKGDIKFCRHNNYVKKCRSCFYKWWKLDFKKQDGK